MHKDFFEKDTICIAQSLLGMYLIHESPQGKTVGKIVETEAYLFNDPAAHSYRGKTPRNAPMFGKAGTSYVYFTYGMHYCFNVVTGKQGIGEAVLIRALQPIDGLELMKQRRKQQELSQLCNGPAKLVQAMGINKEQNSIALQQKPLYLEEGTKETFSIVKRPRIGISLAKNKLFRFYIKGNTFVSKK